MKSIELLSKKRWSINGTLISFYDNEAEDKPAIIFIHAFPLDKEIWKDQLNYFNEGFRVIAYDLRGFGNSSLGYKPLSIRLFVEDLYILLQKLRLTNVILCGLSLGGYVSLSFYKAYPDLIRALILCDTQCRADSKLEISNRYKNIDDIINFGLIYFSEMLLPKLLSEAALKKRVDLVSNLRYAINSNKKEAIAFTLMALANREDTCTYLDQIKVPTLVITGELDRITPPEEGMYLHENISDSQFKIISHAGHLSNLEDPGSFNKVLEKFLISAVTEH